ncbi:ABC-type cobalamin transport system, permease component [Candidatus Regiella insecticola 5.15]|uniref:ABC-type cobalamin transport system, permease component n=1 Tax=Candidatus Regiella insecticola 5.15 TaxID=1005043 RepID=G2GXK6_9ENTR|nr:ABC-type cobalamin transport system, permease component [Candidatus Regiella insecticola 5.15]
MQQQSGFTSADVLDDGRIWRYRLAATRVGIGIVADHRRLCCQGERVNFIALGEQQARQLGLAYRLWRNLLILAIGWLVGISVALAGVIGFIGFVIPHLLRLSGLTDQRRLLLGCALAGSTVLLLADVVARMVLSSAEIPIGVVTATLGAPVFIGLLMRRQTT